MATIKLARRIFQWTAILLSLSILYFWHREIPVELPRGILPMVVALGLILAFAGFALLRVERNAGDSRFMPYLAGIMIVLASLIIFIDRISNDARFTFFTSWNFYSYAFGFSLLTLGVGLLALGRDRTFVRWLPAICGACLFYVSVGVICTFVFEVSGPIRHLPTTYSIPFWAYFIFMGLSLIFSSESLGVQSLLNARTLGGYVARIATLPVLLLPPLWYWIVWSGARLGWYNPDLAMIILVVVPLICYTVTQWWLAMVIHRSDREKTSAESARRSIFQEMAAYKRSEEERARLASIVESSEDAIISATFSGRIISWNPGAEQLYGYSAEEVLGKSISMLLPSKNIEDFKPLAELVQRRCHAEPIETIRIAKDKTPIPVSETHSLIMDSRGKAVGISGIARNISKRKKIEQDLRRANTALERSLIEMEAVIEHMNEGLLFTDKAGNIRLINQAACRMFHLDGLYPSLRNLKEYDYRFQMCDLNGNVLPFNCWPFSRIFQGETLVNAEFLIRRRDESSETDWIGSVNGAPIYDKAGNFSFAIVTIRDITAQKHIEAELISAMERADNANQAKTHFLANMSHEIRTPLSAILGFAELLLEPNQSGSERLNCVSAIIKNGRVLSDLVHDILDLSKVEAGQIQVERLEVSLPDLLYEMRGLFVLRAREKGIQLTLSSEGPIPTTITTDPTRFKQILVNVIGNAVKFTDFGKVEVSAQVGSYDNRRRDGFLKITVKDTGIGIDHCYHAKLFRPFSQADSSTTRRFGGTGLGLALSKELAKALGGDLVLSRSVPQEGSVFEIMIDTGSLQGRDWLKLEDAMGLEDSTEMMRPARSDILLGKTILLAEDSYDNQLLIKKFLTLAGAEVDTAMNGREAIQKATDRDYDVILMDVQMPELDGIAATRKLRNNGYKRPIVALTAHALREERDKTLEAGCDDHLTKPIQRHELVRRVAALAGSPSFPEEASLSH